MDAKEISLQEFDVVLKGYKPESVKSYLAAVAEEMAALQREARESEKKLEVLADKIREYREDEDDLKNALLVAQKQKSKILAEAKEKAAELVEKATQEATDIVDKANGENARLKSDGEQLKRELEAEHERIVAETNAEKERIIAEMNAKIELQNEILLQTKTETLDYRQKLTDNFRRYMSIFEKIPENCENDFVKTTAAAHQNSTVRTVTIKKEPAAAVEKPAPAKQEQNAEAPEAVTANTPTNTTELNLDLVFAEQEQQEKQEAWSPKQKPKFGLEKD
ncbi:hypothetical protein FACS189499_09600 [Clostridia bacterium]|nr:hypothetical protein FACS189499_09600 [Clostridia bacterium]